jgi:Na+/H+-dicarboxylate symporter
MLDAYNHSHLPSESLKSSLVSDINSLLKKKDFYQKDLFKDIDVPGETIEKLKGDLPEKDIFSLNRKLLEIAYSDEIGKSEKARSLLDVLINIVPTNPVAAFIEGNMLQIIFMALLFGVVLTLIPAEKSEGLIKFIDGLNDVFIQVVHIVMKLAPYGVFALSAAVIGQFGMDILVTLLKYSTVVIGGLILYTLSINSLSIKVLGKVNPVLFFKAVKEAIIIAFSTSSSMATLPVAMESVEHIGVKREYSSFVIPLGSTVNMDGTALYQGVSAVFIAQIYGIHLGIVGQVTIVLMAVLSSIGAAGVPMAGIIALALVLKQLGIPLEGIALIMGVERLLDMVRTCTNVIGNMACSVVIQELEEKTKK